jgi:hypothetical protein
MTAEKGLTILQEIVAQRLRWGRQTAPPYTIAQIMEALELVSAAGFLGKPKYAEADVILLRRQLGAAKSRLRKHLGKDVTEDGDENITNES